MSASLQQLGRSIITGQRRGPLASIARAGLAVVEPLYANAMRIRNRKYDSGRGVARLPRPTISVGNITTGGTGKTPTVQWLAEQLRARGRNPAVLLRGYRSTDAAGSDEATMLAESLAIAVQASPDRAAAAARVLHGSPNIDVFILDDGFQHRRVARDFDLVLINAAEPFGYGHVLPRGLLREPLPGLRRSHAILLTHWDTVSRDALAAIEQQLSTFSPAPIYRSAHRHTALRSRDDQLPLETLAATRFIGFAAIGSPETFERALRTYSTYAGGHWFGDHHDYTQGDVDGLIAEAKKAGAELLVTTEKDWVKLRRLKIEMPIVRVSMQLQFEDDHAEKLMAQVMACLSRG